MRITSGSIPRALTLDSFEMLPGNPGLSQLDHRFEADDVSTPNSPFPFLSASSKSSEPSTSSLSQSSNLSTLSSDPQEDVLRGIQGLRLLTTTGLTGTDLSSIIGGLEICGVCGRLFTGVALRLHIIGCVAARESREKDLTGWYEDDGEDKTEEEPPSYEGKGKARAE